MTNPTTTDWRELCAELFEIVEDEYSGSSCLTELRNRTATALAQPKPPSLKEQAITELDNAVLRGDCITVSDALPTIRRALEQLDD